MSDKNPLVPRNHREPNRVQRFARRKEAAVASATLALGGGGLAITAAATGHWWLVIPSVLTSLASAVFSAAPFTEAFVLFPGQSASGGDIGLGADVDATAIVEPGARVEMGATVQAGAIVRTGAVVGMGSTVQSRAIVEEDAIVGWGATVQVGAVVSRGAVIGAGSTVQANAVVPANVRLGAGSTVTGAHGDLEVLPAASAPRQPESPVQDERDARVDALCARIEAELAGASSSVDEFLGNPRETIQTVRRTCHDLLKRERALRKVLDPVEQARIAQEVTSLESRIAAETDAITRQRLQGAVAAITEHRRQRDLLLRDANRLEAEHTRLLWTLEGLLAHVIRLRTTEAGASSPELDRGLAQLREEVASIASAMEHVQALDLGLAPSPEPISEVSSTPPAEKVRERD